MAQFTTNLPGASGPSLPSQRNLAGSGADFSGISRAVGDVFEERAEKRAEEKENSVFAEVVNEQTELVQEFFSSDDTVDSVEEAGADVFQQSTDTNRDQALQNPNVRAALRQVDRISQARAQSSNPADLEKLFLRMADLNKRMLNDHPQHAQIVIDASKKALGFDPLEKAIGLAQAEAVKQRDFERAQTKALVDKAVNAGLVDIGPDGSFDVEDARRKGQAIAQQEFILDQQKAQADLLAASRTPEPVLKREMFSNYVNSTSPMFKASISSFGANMLQLIPELEGDPAAENKIREAWGQRRSVFKAHH